MTFILIVKNKNGVVMAVDRRFIVSEPNNGRYAYHDDGIKMIANSKHSLGICLQNHMELGAENSLQKSFDDYFKRVKQEQMKQTDLLTVFLRFPKFFVKECMGEGDSERVIQQINQNDTYLFAIRWREKGFEILSTKVKNLFFLAEQVSSGIVLNEVEPQEIERLVQTKTISFQDNLFFASDKEILKEICPEFTEKSIENDSLSALGSKMRNVMVRIIKSSPYFGGNPTLITIDNNGVLSHDDLSEPAHIDEKFFSQQDSIQIQSIMSSSQTAKFGIMLEGAPPSHARVNYCSMWYKRSAAIAIGIAGLATLAAIAKPEETAEIIRDNCNVQ